MTTNTFQRTDIFDAWLRDLLDQRARARIIARIAAAQLGNLGDVKSVGAGVIEMRIDVGPGYRVYFARIGSRAFKLLCRGDKASQQADIATAHRMVRENQMGKARSVDRKRVVRTDAPFDAVDYLDNEEVIAEYLATALEDANPEVFLRAMADVARARGIADVAKVSGLGRESLYKALAPGAKVRYETVRKIVDSLGVRLTIVTA